MLADTLALPLADAAAFDDFRADAFRRFSSPLLILMPIADAAADAARCSLFRCHAAFFALLPASAADAAIFAFLFHFAAMPDFSVSCLPSLAAALPRCRFTPWRAFALCFRHFL